MGTVDFGAEWKRKRIQQLKKKIRGARAVLRECAQESDVSSEAYQKAQSQLANFQTQLDALLTGGGMVGVVVPIRPAGNAMVAIAPVCQPPPPREDPRTPLYPPHAMGHGPGADLLSDGPPTLLEGTPTVPPASQRSMFSN